MSWADGSTPVGSNVTFTPTYPSGLTTQQGYVDTALQAATATVQENMLTVEIPKFNSAFTNFVGGANSGDITVKVAFASGSVAVVKASDSSAVTAPLTIANDTFTIQEVKAILYVVDGSGNKVELKESDIRSGAERYIVIEQQGNAGGGSRWSIKSTDNGCTRRPKVAVNAFSTDMTDPNNQKDTDTEWEKIEDYWCAVDETVVNPKDSADKHRYYSLDWINCQNADGTDADVLKFKVPQIEDFTIAEDLDVYGRLLRGMIGGTGGGGGNPTVEPYWGTNGLMKLTIKNDIEDASLQTITGFEELDETYLQQEVNYGTSVYNIRKPSKVIAHVEGVEDPVEFSSSNINTWEQSPAYDNTVAGDYTFTFKYSTSEYKLAKGVQAPKMKVTVKPGVISSLNEYQTEYRVKQGTPESELPLPQNLSGKVGYTVINNIPVSWSCEDYNANAAAGTEFTFNGTVDATKFNAESVTIAPIKITLTENAEITVFNRLNIWDAKQTVPVGTELADLHRPDTIAVTANGKKTDLPVQWQSQPEYDANTEGVYTFTPVLPDGYAPAEGVEGVSLQVEVRKPDLSIGTAAELVKFLDDSSTTNSETWKNKLVVLTADIDMYGQRTQGMRCFEGTFDGQGHRIYNLNDNTGSGTVLF